MDGDGQVVYPPLDQEVRDGRAVENGGLYRKSASRPRSEVDMFRLEWAPKGTTAPV